MYDTLVNSKCYQLSYLIKEGEGEEGWGKENKVGGGREEEEEGRMTKKKGSSRGLELAFLSFFF